MFTETTLFLVPIHTSRLHVCGWIDQLNFVLQFSAFLISYQCFPTLSVGSKSTKSCLGLLFTTQSQLLTILKQNAFKNNNVGKEKMLVILKQNGFENLVGKRGNAGR